MKCRKCRRRFIPYVVDSIHEVAIHSSICRKCRKKEVAKMSVTVERVKKEKSLKKVQAIT